MTQGGPADSGLICRGLELVKVLFEWGAVVTVWCVGIGEQVRKEMTKSYVNGGENGRLVRVQIIGRYLG